jgi:hypothetical protein
MAARTGAGSLSGFEHVLDPVDDQRIMVTVDSVTAASRMPSRSSGARQAKRAAAADDRQHAAAQRRQAGDMLGGARHRDQRVELDHAFDPGGGKRDALAGDPDDEQKFVHTCAFPVAASRSATSRPARS